MDSFTLRCFLAVADTGSFTKAAGIVKRTQSAVTQQVCRLEKSLGRQLFRRGSKRTELTSDGEIFQGYAEKIFALHQEVFDRLKNPGLEGEVRFGLPEDFATTFLSDVLIDFSRNHPRVLLNVECGLTLNLYHQFKQGGFDIVLVKMSRPEDFPSGVEVWSESLEWVGKDSLKENLETGTPLPLVLAPQPCVYRARAIEALEQKGIDWRIVYTSASYAGKIASVKAGMGATVLPRKLISDDLTIIRHPLLPELPDIHVSLLKQEGKHGEAIRNLEEYLLKRLH